MIIGVPPLPKSASNPRARFASPEMAPIGPTAAREIATKSAQLAAIVEDLCLTNETLWDENKRLQDGVDRSLGIIAELRGRLGIRPSPNACTNP